LVNVGAGLDSGGAGVTLAGGGEGSEISGDGAGPCAKAAAPRAKVVAKPKTNLCTAGSLPVGLPLTRLVYTTALVTGSKLSKFEDLQAIFRESRNCFLSIAKRRYRVTRAIE